MADVIFIHGPGGDAYGTWQHGVGLEAWWPSWIAGDSKRVGVWSLDYDAAPSVWLGRAMRTVDRANNVLALLDAEGFGKRPLFLVCHSFGGLVAKQLLRSADGYGPRIGSL